MTQFELKWADRVTFTITQPKSRPAYIPKTRGFVLKFHALSEVLTPVLESVPAVKMTHMYDPKVGCWTVVIPAADFESVTITFPCPQILKKSMLKNRAYNMLQDADAGTLRKQLLYNAFFKKEAFTEADLKVLFRKIAYRV